MVSSLPRVNRRFGLTKHLKRSSGSKKLIYGSLQYLWNDPLISRSCIALLSVTVHDRYKLKLRAVPDDPGLYPSSTIRWYRGSRGSSTDTPLFYLPLKLITRYMAWYLLLLLYDNNTLTAISDSVMYIKFFIQDEDFIECLSNHCGTRKAK